MRRKTAPAPAVPPALPDGGRDHVVGLFRAVVGFLLACHGAATLFGVLGGPHGGRVPDIGQWPSWWAAVIQLAGGLLVTLGLCTRTAAVVCSGSMAYAYFTVHQPKSLFPIENGGESAALFCWAFLLTAALGPGRWSLDALRAGRGEPREDARGTLTHWKA
ncbi:DoxX family protein [Streptomyces sp. HK10]|uniref:DoxX family protein n=1 Tax=Streptomyces sp. HK10 TaxID=3373255 RepID=UPI003747FABA